jgi:hypothetical protein
MIKEIAKLIVDCCAANNVDAELVLSKSKQYKAATMRHVLIYYLHTEKGISANRLSRVLGISCRRIYSSAETIRHRLTFEKNFLSEYNNLLSCVKGATN